MDFNKLVIDLVQEIKAFGITYIVMAKHLGISRQAFDRRLRTNCFTTEDLTRLSAMSVTWCGGTVLVDFVEVMINGEVK